MTHRLTAGDKEAYAAYAMGLISGSFDLVDAEDHGFDANLPVFTVGQTADLVNIHPQTLRQYDRLDLIVPRRTPGGARRYSLRDISRLVARRRRLRMARARGRMLPAGTYGRVQLRITSYREEREEEE